jgi:hypothetical protein
MSIFCSTKLHAVSASSNGTLFIDRKESQQVRMELCLLTERAAVFVSGFLQRPDSLAHALQRVLTPQVNESFFFAHILIS